MRTVGLMSSTVCRQEELSGAGSSPLGLAAELKCLEGLGFSEDVVHTIQDARAASTRVS